MIPIYDGVFRVVTDRHDLFPYQSQEDLEAFPIPGDKPRPFHFLKVIRMAIVVLKPVAQLGKCDVGNEDQPDQW